MANLETPEQVREKMALRLNELKQKREEERVEEVNRRLEQRFKDTTDDLRKEQGKFFVYQCQMEREKQLMDKKRAADNKIMEEHVYAQLWKLDLQAKEERELKEVEEKKKRVNDTQAVLDWQKDTRIQAKVQDRELTEVERQMLKEQWKREDEIEKEMERQKHVLTMERNLELIRHNEAEKLLREDQLRVEKERDKIMLNKALTREQQIAELEEAERLRRRQEVIDLQKFYMQKAEDKKAEEQLIEYLTWLESEKQWKLKEDKWRKEDEARINLMRQVYEDRAKTIGARQMQVDEEKWRVQYEKQIIDEEIAKTQAEMEEKKNRDTIIKKNNQADILKQINERDREQRRVIQEKMFEERAAKLAELEYTRRIQDQKQANAAILSQWKSQSSNFY